MKFNRLAVSMAIAALGAVSSAVSAAPASGVAPKYVFYFIGDGMGFHHVVNADLYKTRVLGDSASLTMLSFPVASAIRTHSASSDVTDSAAAGTALATGSKTRNNMLGMNADTVAVTSIARTLFDNGFGVGLITTVGIDDATPGAFYAHVPSRHERMTVGRQLAESGYQFAAGAGLAEARDKEGRSTGLLEYFAQQGVKVSYGPEGLEEVADRMLVLSHDTVSTWNVGYAIDSIPGALTLPQMTRAAIRHLSRVSPDRFFLMAEGGSIDHAGHANDGGTIVREVISFDQAIAVAYDFYLAHPDETLIVVTADHETGGFSIGNNTTGYAVYPSGVSSQKISKEAFDNYVKSLARNRMVYTWNDMKEYLSENLGFWRGVEITPAETAALEEMFSSMMEGRNSAADQKTLYASFNAFSAEVFRLLNDKAGYGFTTVKHTGAPVPVFAVGAGAEAFSSFSDNTEIPVRILSLTLGK